MAESLEALSVISSAKHRRSDAGPRLTDRDMACLKWVAQQYAIRLDQLQRLLLRFTPEEDRSKVRTGADRLSRERTYRTLARWESLGLIEYASILDGEPRWVWLSGKGLREIGSTLRYNRPSAVRLRHLYWTNQVRLWVESRRPQDLWRSEREIKATHQAREAGEHQEHLPDAVLHAANGRISAIEVELEPKASRQLEAIVAELEAGYTSILYFAAPIAQRQLAAMFATFEPDRRRHFLLYAVGPNGNEDEMLLLEE
jgi:hypothetical protein